MTKVILWVFLIVVVLFGLRLLNMAKAKRRAAAPPRGPSPADTMVRCALCGVYLPRADAASGPNGLTCGDAGCVQKR